MKIMFDYLRLLKRKATHLKMVLLSTSFAVKKISSVTKKSYIYMRRIRCVCMCVCCVYVLCIHVHVCGTSANSRHKFNFKPRSQKTQVWFNFYHK